MAPGSWGGRDPAAQGKLGRGSPSSKRTKTLEMPGKAGLKASIFLAPSLQVTHGALQWLETHGRGSEPVDDFPFSGSVAEALRGKGHETPDLESPHHELTRAGCDGKKIYE